MCQVYIYKMFRTCEDRTVYSWYTFIALWLIISKSELHFTALRMPQRHWAYWRPSGDQTVRCLQSDLSMEHQVVRRLRCVGQQCKVAEQCLPLRYGRRLACLVAPDREPGQGLPGKCAVEKRHDGTWLCSPQPRIDKVFLHNTQGPTGPPYSFQPLSLYIYIYIYKYIYIYI